MDGGAWWAAVHGVTKSRTRLSDFTFTFHFHAVEKEMATHSSVLAWRIPGTGEPGGLPSMGSHRVGHDWSDLATAVVKIVAGPSQKFTQNQGTHSSKKEYNHPHKRTPPHMHTSVGSRSQLSDAPNSNTQPKTAQHTHPLLYFYCGTDFLFSFTSNILNGRGDIAHKYHKSTTYYFHWKLIFYIRYDWIG